MKNILQFDFSVDKDNKTIRVIREFAAPVERVWAAWTESRILDQWWAPKPYMAKTKTMDFRVGGSWFYAMEGPEGTVHWCRADYLSIDPLKSFSGLDAFCDEHGNINPEFPRAQWHISFARQQDSTVVTIAIQYTELADLEKIIEMGFREGFTAALGNLDTCLES